MIDLGTGSSFDITSYAGYESFTADNFIVEPTDFTNVAGSNSGDASGRGSTNASGTLVKSYSNGILSAYLRVSATLVCGYATPWRGSANVSVHAYKLWIAQILEF